MNNLTNPLINFSNLANLTALGQSGSKKEGNSGVDLSALFANNLASTATNLNSEDKSKSTKTSLPSTTTTSNLSKNKTGLNSSSAAAVAAAASMLGPSGLGSSALPFLYSNPNFPLYNPLGLSNFGLTSPFLNNSNLMNGLANFSNVFTSTTSTLSSNSNQSSKAPKASTSKASPKLASSRATASSASTSAASGLSLASGLLATGSSVPHPSSATLDSDDGSLKSLMGNDEEDDLNGEFDTENTEEMKGRKSKSSPSKPNKPTTTPPKEGKPKRSTSK